MSFEWSAIASAWPQLMQGSWMTLKITFWGLLGGTAIGVLLGVIVTYIRVPVTGKSLARWALALLALVLLLLTARWAIGTLDLALPGWTSWGALLLLLAGLSWRWPRLLPRLLAAVAQFYILIVRGTPIVVQVMFIYFALPLIVGMRINGVTAATLTLMINSGAYIAEIVRAGLQSVPRGLHEAGQAMGLPFYKILAFIIGPLALRNMIPTMGNQCIISLKDSSLFIVIGVAELTRQGQEIIATNFRAVEIWGVVALIYLFMTSCIALALKLLEHKTQIP